MNQSLVSDHAQQHREARWALYLSAGYLLGWVGFAYFSPEGMGVFGLPLWFELSCIFLPIIFILLSIVVLKFVYQDIKLPDMEDMNEDIS